VVEIGERLVAAATCQITGSLWIFPVLYNGPGDAPPKIPPSPGTIRAPQLIHGSYEFVPKQHFARFTFFAGACGCEHQPDTVVRGHNYALRAVQPNDVVVVCFYSSSEASPALTDMTVIS